MNDRVELLKAEIMRCNKCDLAKTRNNVIFGEGNINGGIRLILPMSYLFSENLLRVYIFL